MLHINIVGFVTCSDKSSRTLHTCHAYNWIFFSIYFIITLHSFIAATSASQYKKKLKFNKIISPILVDNAAANEQFTVADLPGRQRLRSASSADLAVPQTCLQTVGDRAFCVAAAKTWNSLPSEVTSSVTLSTFKQKLKTCLFHCHFPARNISPY